MQSVKAAVILIITASVSCNAKSDGESISHIENASQLRFQRVVEVESQLFSGTVRYCDNNEEFVSDYIIVPDGNGKFICVIADDFDTLAHICKLQEQVSLLIELKNREQRNAEIRRTVRPIE